MGNPAVQAAMMYSMKVEQDYARLRSVVVEAARVLEADPRPANVATVVRLLREAIR